MQYSIILTVYNEEHTVGTLVSELEKLLGTSAKKTEIIIVDDGSTDRSQLIVSALTKRYCNLKIIKNPRNLGRGFALKKGIAQSTGKIVGIIDTDLQYSPEDLMRALRAVQNGEADLVFGDRQSNKNNIVRRLLSLGFNAYCRFLFSLPLHDANSGIKAGKRKIFEKTPLREGAYRLLGARAAKKYRIAEIEIQHKRRPYGKTRIPTPKIFIETLKELVLVSIKK